MTEQSSMNNQSASEIQNINSQEKLISVLDSLFFVSDRAITTQELIDLMPEFSSQQIKEALKVMLENQTETMGTKLVEVQKGYQYRTVAQNKDWITRFLKAKPLRLSRASLEALSIIAYRQPITRPEVDEIRGVDSSGVMRLLLERGLVRILGKRDEPGYPLLYGTTKEFLSFFNLKNLSDLPPLTEYTELGEDSLKKLEHLFPDQDPAQIEQRVQGENILPENSQETES